MLSAAMLAFVLLAGGEDRLAAPQIRARDGAVTIHADKLPLSQILDRLASATGMKVTYEGSRPSMPITMVADGITETEAILRLMEGLGISYVLRTDASGDRVDTLIVSGAGGGTLVASSQPPAPEPPYEEPVGDYAHIPLDPAVIEAAGGPQKPDLNNPYLGLPPQHFPPGMLPPQPEFPQGASYPR